MKYFVKAVENNEVFLKEINEEKAKELEQDGFKVYKEEDSKQEEKKEETKDNTKKDYSDIGSNLSDMIGKTVKDSLDLAGKTISGVFGDDSRNPKSKTAKLLKVLPFLDDEDVHDLVMGIINGDESLKDVNIVAIMPFLDDDDADMLFIRAIEDGNTSFTPEQIAPFVSEEAMGKIVDMYIDGKYPDLDINRLYPFMASKDIKRVVKKIIEDKENKEDQ